MVADLIMPMTIEAKALDQDRDNQNRQNSPRPRPRLNGLFSPIERNLS